MSFFEGLKCSSWSVRVNVFPVLKICLAESKTYFLRIRLALVTILPYNITCEDFFYVHGSVHRESVSTTVQQDATIYTFIISLPTALHVSDDTFIHHQEDIQTLIKTSGTGRTVFATFR